MTGCQMAVSCRGAMDAATGMCVDRRLWAGTVEQAVDVMMTSEVGDDRAGRRHEVSPSSVCDAACYCDSGTSSDTTPHVHKQSSYSTTHWTWSLRHWLVLGNVSANVVQSPTRQPRFQLGSRYGLLLHRVADGFEFKTMSVCVCICWFAYNRSPKFT